MIRRATELNKFKNKAGEEVTREVNVITIVGNMTADAGLKTVTVSGEEKSVLGGNASLAVSRGPKAPAVFFRVEAWGVVAERLANFAKKGNQLVLVGEVKDDSYTPEGKEKIEREKIVVTNFEVIRKAKVNTEAAPETSVDGSVDSSYEFSEVTEDDYDDVPF